MRATARWHWASGARAPLRCATHWWLEVSYFSVVVAKGERLLALAEEATGGVAGFGWGLGDRLLKGVQPPQVLIAATICE